MVRYRMLGHDADSNPTQERVWVVNNTPDLTAAQYTGLKSGKNPLVDIAAYAVEDPNAIVSFLLPFGDQWNPPTSEGLADFPIRKVLPDSIEDSQLVILSGPDGYDGSIKDGYAYMFGGKTTNKIYRASLNNPADWIDTGARLPTNLYGAALAIVGARIYLFGGNTGDGYGNNIVDTIFSAPISNPLNWTSHGSRLPKKLCYSNLGMADGYLWLFGGKSSDGYFGAASDAILKASTSDPLTWTDTGSHLPIPIYGSVFSEVGGFWRLHGGMQGLRNQTNIIWKASVSSPTMWSLDGYLPYATSFGQFFTIGDNGYMIGPMVGSPSGGFTSIIRCDLDTPNVFVDTGQVVRGVISHSQLAIIYDRVWLFGGSGETAIFACNRRLKYDFGVPVVLAYGQITRVLLPATDNLTNPFQVLGMPWWRCDYRF